jgi:hypothetical protein
MAGPLGIHLGNADAITDAQAVYGGLELGLGAFLAVCAFRPDLRWAGLIAATLTLGGLALARSIGVLMVHTPITGATRQLLATDLGGTVLNAVVLVMAARRRRA